MREHPRLGGAKAVAAPRSLELRDRSPDCEIEAVNKGILQGAPELATMHNCTPDFAGMQRHHTLHFASINFWSVYAVPDYVRWLRDAPPDGVFNTHQRFYNSCNGRGPRAGGP